MDKRILLLLAALLFAGPAGAQDQLMKEGSTYSFFGVGEPNDFRSSYAEGMGLSGIAMHHSRINNMANPAIWGHSLYTNASGTFLLRGIESTDRNGEETVSQFAIGQFQLLLPLSREQVGASVSLMPLTRSSYRKVRETVLPADRNNSGEELRYTMQSTGMGGLSRLEVGFGWRITDGIAVGYAPSLIFGTLEQDMLLEFEDLAYRPLNQTRYTSSTGMGNRFGLYLTGSDWFTDDDHVSLGMTYNLPADLSTTRELESDIGGREVMLRDSDFYGERTTRLPEKAGLGLAYVPGIPLTVSTDAVYERWGEFETFSGSDGAAFQDRIRGGFGLEYRAVEREEGGFFSNFIYRAGLTLDSGNLKIGGHRIDEYRLNAGIGIPSRQTGSSIDFTMQYGSRGMVADDLVQEEIFSLRVSFNLSELMFLQRRFD